MKLSKWITVCVLPLALLACGGGGGGAGPIASTETFQLRKAYINELSAVQKPVTVSGTVTSNNKVTTAVSGSGSYSKSNLTPDNFRDQSALKQTTSMSITVQGNGRTAEINTASNSYYDTNYKLLGFTSSNSYSEVQGNGYLPPETAKVGDVGAPFKVNIYTDSSKSIQTGYIVQQYFVEPDTASTALVRVSYEQYDMQSNLIVSSNETFRIKPDGSSQKLFETVSTLSPNTSSLRFDY